ncbi:hypothetical protein BKA70DRAFT_1286343 [Coprinopsis sp. MPI-PUGE-AT-0042]|nr:hypothetical protein BKA70DRAFT_1286343 [Coprinopsis sp. MPI-PUGE-AT-0042]
MVGSWLSIQISAFGICECALWGIFLESLQPGCYVNREKYLFAGIGFMLLELNEFIVGVGFYRYRNLNSTLVRTLYCDGIFYYVFLFLISMGQVIVILAGPVRCY